MALTDTAKAIPAPRWRRPAALIARLASAEHLLLQRLAGTVFMIRVITAALAYGSQVLFARWMGTYEFGIYVYVWTWVLLLGPMLDMGLSSAAQRFIPQYREHKLFDLLRGYVTGARWLGIAIGIVAAAICAGLVRLLQPWLPDYTVVPLYLACIALPACALANIQDGISRSYDWMGLALTPTFVVRQLLLTALMAGAWLTGVKLDAVSAMVLAAIAIWLPMLGQLVVLNRRLRARIPPGPKTYDVRLWLRTALPILMAESFFLMLAHTDVLMLQQFRSPDEVAVYYAAAKTMALVSFVQYSMAATSAHRFSSFHAADDHAGLAAFLRHAIRWTFWPALALAALLLALGWPLLRLFGPEFTAGYPLMFILGVGLLARAAIGPTERLLNMLGQQRLTACACALAFAVNIGLCFALIPAFGAVGAAVATASALSVETIALLITAKHRLGFDVLIRRGAQP